jgi:hypothetical protein
MRQPTLAWNNFPPYRRAVQIIRSIAPALTAAAGLLLVGPLAGCDAAAHAIEGIQSAASNSARQPVGGGSAREVAQALAQLESIPVKGRAQKTGYTRDEFGPAWADTDHNGCDTRNDGTAPVSRRTVLHPGGYETPSGASRGTSLSHERASTGYRDACATGPVRYGAGILT